MKTHPIDLCAATDAELIQICRQGDQNAYGQIVERYQSLICSIAYNRCGDLALSEDLAQDAFILAWQKLVDLKDVGKFKAWICTIVRNLANRSSQRSSRNVIRTAANLDAVADISSDIETPIERAVSAEEEKMVWEALAEVPENYREPMILFYREEQSVARVAQALDLSEDAVKQRLSRGRKMLQQHMAGVIESALTSSKPTKAFTGAVLLGLSGATAKTAAAAGVTTATATGAKAAAGVGAGSGLGSLFLLTLLKLPVMAWLVKMSFDETRSQRERKLLLRSYLISICGLVFYVGILIPWVWWGHTIEIPLLRDFLPPLMMIVLLVPWILYCRRMGKQIERIRIEEGNFTPPRPLVESDSTGPIDSKVYGLFFLCSLLVVAGPAILPFVARDWLGLSAMLASAICISQIAAHLSLRFPKGAFQIFGMGVGLPGLVAIGITVWKMSIWESAFVDFLPWFLGAMSALSLTLVIVTSLVWKRVYGRPSSPEKGTENSGQQE